MSFEKIIELLLKNLSDWLAVLISIGAFVFSIMQFACERRRNRKEATIHAFDALEESESFIYLFSLTKKDVDDLVKRHTVNDKRIDNEWQQLCKALPLIEHFAVGVNSKIYDVETLNSMAGNKFITTYYACDELLKYKRSGDGNEKNYSEFEKMVNFLISIRKKQKQSIPQKN